MNRLFWPAAAVVVLFYGVLAFWSLPLIAREADGLTPFDLRAGGYGLEEAQAFLSALSEEGRAHYLGLHRTLDMIYPAVLGLFLCWAIVRLTADMSEWIQAVLIAMAAIAMSFDYQENIHIGRMLTAGAEAVPVELVEAASSATVRKSVLVSLTLFGLLGLVLRKRLRRKT